MKEKKFEKIIEWEKEPREILIFGGILSGVFGILNFVSGFFSEEILSMVILAINTSVFILLGMLLLYFGVGEGKKVYYKEIKK